MADKGCGILARASHREPPSSPSLSSLRQHTPGSRETRASLPRRSHESHPHHTRRCGASPTSPLAAATAAAEPRGFTFKPPTALHSLGEGDGARPLLSSAFLGPAAPRGLRATTGQGLLRPPTSRRKGSPRKGVQPGCPVVAQGGNGAVYGAVALADAPGSALRKTREFVTHVEGGGQVRATVSSTGSGGFLVELEATLQSRNYDSSLPLLLHWGIHRSDSSSWFLLEPGEAPPGTEFLQDEETEAMRTPFLAQKTRSDNPTPASRRSSSSSSSGIGSRASSSGSSTLPRQVDDTAQRLAIQFSAELAPFSLDFVLYQPPGGGRPEQYFGSTRCPSFSVPVGMDRGAPEPLGATRLPDGSVNFALYSRHAQGVTLCLYRALDAQPALEIDLDPSGHKTGDVWHVRLPALGTLSKYGFRCKGDVAWDHGDRFHPRSVLLDPYARILAAPVAGQEELPSPAAVLGAVPGLAAPGFDWEGDYPPRLPEEQLSLYRLNVGAFTVDDASGIPAPERGTFLGVARKAQHLHSLGVNAVLLQPVAAFDEAQGSYFPFSLFAPMPAYGVGGDPGLASRDFKCMVRELHKWGIEVLLEVVVSHTAEQNDQDPKTISFRGVDHRTYYITDAEGNQVVPPFGAPNALNCNHPVTHSLIVDALKHWVQEYHVDGFSFPNVQALVTGPHGQPVSRPLLVEALSFEPELAAAKLIADPCSPTTGACMGSLVPHWWRWMEMNYRFKADVRRFLRGSPGQMSSIATRITGSGDMFSSGRGPSFGLNHVTSFTGLTLADLVSYSVDSEDSWGCGVDGASLDPYINATRMRQVRNFLCALYFSLGVPVLVMGDEYGASKGGKLNALDWDGMFLWPSLETDLAQQLTRFVATLAEIRRRHKTLERKDFWFAGDMTWHGVRAWEQPAWDDPNSSFLAYSVRLMSPALPAESTPTPAQLGDGSTLVPTPVESEAVASTVESCLYVAFNAQQYAVQVELPEPPPGTRWLRIVDTSEDHPKEISAEPLHLSSYSLSHFSVLALEARKIDAVSLEA